MIRELLMEYSAAEEVRLFLENLRGKCGDASEKTAVDAGIEVCFHEFASELDGLPGEYAAPSGRLLLAFDENRAAGCGAFRSLNKNVCEMKRLYVRPAFRGKKIGAKLVLELIEQAKKGYQTMRLDTLPSMTRAIALYRSLGFREIPPYQTNPIPSALCFELELQKHSVP